MKLVGLLEYAPYKKIQESLSKIEDINISKDFFEPFNTNPILDNIFATLVQDANEDIKNHIDDIITRIFNALRSNIKESTVYTISIGNNDSKACTAIRCSIISYLTDNNYLNNVHVVFKIKTGSDDYYLTKIFYFYFGYLK